ncbi:hypothetical protein COX24_03770 [bacterium (Candidatus Gribaldobacteria) CG23_combo_of_CG06-09_8_20_14_all_37_87_8]|uniref:Uncharacterized protein n=1 Tax=bacterium (Candidatus Gribaldobacteria) CG23_combo_of_CG06-09_8_20_14_all_37_87_8 TaxID=2014278 RepID=A0A2G9ZGE4_9BACT|nr:MAG: hypothetical protein AUJ25_02090 [Parcubacteria group bacterium CG1_02_37_13]PIP31408.1 MAG: hypothetical protein COX24_03770 [bacterium (Candidatus Gribaldobacteria) CG23_combo_of_CG06-09_8_20_14_all_37_87_8]
MALSNIKVNKNTIKTQGGVVVLGLQEYKQFLLYEMEREQNDFLVKEALKEEKDGQTKDLGTFLKEQHPKLYENYIN